MPKTLKIPKSFPIYCNWCGKEKTIVVAESTSMFRMRFCSYKCKKDHSNFMIRADKEKKEQARIRHLAYWSRRGNEVRIRRRERERLKKLERITKLRSKHKEFVQIFRKPE